MWLVATLAGVVAVASTALPWQDATDVFERIGPILGFLAAITVLAHVADSSGLFDALAVRSARAARGSTRLLFLAVVAVAAAITVALSLDTTAVLFTPVVLALCGAVEVDARPFAYATVWLANAASLLLPVSNLTNLLAVDRTASLSTLEFAARMALPEAVAIGCVVGFALLMFRRTLRGSYTTPRPYVVEDRFLLYVSGFGCLLVAPISLTGIAPWKVATPVAAVIALIAIARAGPRALAGALPWRILLGVTGMFLAIAALGRHGLDDALRHTTGHTPILTEFVGAATGNVVNNLPAYVTIERAVPPRHTDEILALLLGTNAGTMILITGSLATLLWRERCHARGLRISAWEFARYGVLLVPPMLGLTYAALLATS